MKNLLVHWCNSGRMREVLHAAIKLARSAQANLCGLSIVDARQLGLGFAVEPSGYAGATGETLTQRRHFAAQAAFRELCRLNGVRGDLRERRGDTLDLLVDESRYHDLTIASYAGDVRRDDAELSAHDLIELAQRITQPLLVLRRKPTSLQRALLVYDGSNASRQAIRSFVSQAAYLGNEYRLLCVGEAADPQMGASREMTQFCRSQLASLETGCLPGSPLKTVTKYAEKWEADLLVLGVARSANWWGGPFGQLASDVLLHSDFPIYASA